MLNRIPGAAHATDLFEDLAEQLSLRIRYAETGQPVLAQPDGRAAETWREGFPYPALLGRREYAAAKRDLQIELLKLQHWVTATQRRVAIVFEGRDAAGKGGTIRRFTENLDPRHARVVALGQPTEADQQDWYFRRYQQNLPRPGELVLFDRSWYSRAGVERVMRFCTPRQYREFLAEAPEFERMMADDGVLLMKLWISVTRAEQLRRFVRRSSDPLKRWKLSPVDLASLHRWDEYTAAKESMFAWTGTGHAPWAVIKTNDKRRGRLEAMRWVLSALPYSGRDDLVTGRPDPLIARAVPVLSRGRVS
jgi:polyphosphate kinase 2